MKQLGKFPVFEQKERLYTRSLNPGKSFFDEKLVKDGKIEYREFDHTRSKLAAAIMKGVSQIGIKDQDVVLYLGASHGYTPSFVSDMVGKAGFVFAVDFAPRVVRDLVLLCNKRENICPILADCNHPEEYAGCVSEVDIVYQDIAQKNQVEILKKNLQFLKSGGFALLAVKARSIDVAKRPKDLFKQVRIELEKFISIVDYRELDPFEKDHAFFVCKKK
jgi:fibrillarin-like pre-rRNA processing protein